MSLSFFATPQNMRLHSRCEGLGIILLSNVAGCFASRIRSTAAILASIEDNDPTTSSSDCLSEPAGCIQLARISRNITLCGDNCRSIRWLRSDCCNETVCTGDREAARWRRPAESAAPRQAPEREDVTWKHVIAEYGLHPLSIEP